MNNLISLAKSLSDLGLHAESGLVRSIYKTSSESGQKHFLNTRKFFGDFAIKLAAIIRGEKLRMDQRGECYINMEQFENIYELCRSLSAECESGSLANIPNIFKMRLATVKDPHYPDRFLLNHNGLGYAMGKDIVELSLTPNEAPIQQYSKEYADGETEGVTESIRKIIADQKDKFDKRNEARTGALSDMETRYLGILEAYKNLITKRTDYNDPANWAFSYKRHRGQDDDYKGEKVFTGLSEEKARSEIEWKTKEAEENIKKQREFIGPLDSNFKPSLTPAQMEWVKLLKI
jgi:hypothetical protein